MAIGNSVVHNKARSVMQIVGLGSGVLGALAAVNAIVFGATSWEGTVSIVLLLLIATSLAVALGIQGITYGRAARYAAAMPNILRLTERIWRTDPTVLTPTQATAICDEAVDGLAKILGQVTGHRCHASIEVLTPASEGARRELRRATDYLTVNLSRDAASDGLTHEDQRQHPVQANSSYREVFADGACAAYFLRDDVAADPDYASSESKAENLFNRRRRDPWPLHYRSTLVVKICNAERCSSERDHTPIAFLWLRSPEAGAFDDRYDVELAQRMSWAIAPIVTRCVKATKPTLDFRRQAAAP